MGGGGGGGGGVAKEVISQEQGNRSLYFVTCRLYCKQQKAGWGLGNEAMKLSVIRPVIGFQV